MMTLLLATLLLAQAPDAEAAARVHFDKAERAYRTGNYDVAIAEYQQAYDAKPVPALLFNIAQSYRKRYTVGGQVPDLRRAIEVFRAYLRDDPRTPQRETVEKILAELKATLAEAEARGRAPPAPLESVPTPVPRSLGPGRLVVHANVPNAEVWLGDGTLGPAPNEMVAAAGVHRLRVERRGYATWTAQVELHPDETLRQTAFLLPLDQTDGEEPPVYKKWWFWTIVGGAVLAGTVTAIAVASGGSNGPGGPTIDLSR